MARIRTIKPEFFTHEDLAELSPLERLFFIGLWTQADREGRLEDRPKRLKVVLLPYDACDADSLLGDLADKGFVKRYAVDGKALLEIPGFLKHQRPHPKEPTSDVPAPKHEKKRHAVKKNGETMVNPSLREGVSLREGKESPYSPPKGDDSGFNLFWSEYPKKVARKEALKAWTKIRPANGTQEIIVNALKQHKTCTQWMGERRYIPNPATWLNQRRWEDEEFGREETPQEQAARIRQEMEVEHA